MNGFHARTMALQNAAVNTGETLHGVGIVNRFFQPAPKRYSRRGART